MRTAPGFFSCASWPPAFAAIVANQRAKAARRGAGGKKQGSGLLCSNREGWWQEAGEVTEAILSRRRSGRFGMGPVIRCVKGYAKTFTLSEPRH
jgi:hypothetical protein